MSNPVYLVYPDSLLLLFCDFRNEASLKKVNSLKCGVGQQKLILELSELLVSGIWLAHLTLTSTPTSSHPTFSASSTSSWFRYIYITSLDHALFLLQVRIVRRFY